MDKNLDIITYAVSLVIKAAIMAARFSGRVRKRSLKRLAAMDTDTKDKEILFLKDFSTEQSRVGIRVGTAICVMVRKEERLKNARVRFQHYWGGSKRKDVLESLKLKQLERKYATAEPRKVNRYSFRRLYNVEHDLRFVQDQAGHASPTTTAIYAKTNVKARRRQVEALGEA